MKDVFAHQRFCQQLNLNRLLFRKVGKVSNISVRADIARHRYEARCEIGMLTVVLAAGPLEVSPAGLLVSQSLGFLGWQAPNNEALDAWGMFACNFAN